MGSGDDNIMSDERADRVLRRALERELPATPLPPDLVARTLDRLPASPPAQTARRAAIRRRGRVAALTVVLVPLVLLALFNIWSIAAHGPQMAFFFGDGHTGMSSALLGLHLAAKPLWNTLRTTNIALLVGGLIGLCVCVTAVWRLMRRIQHQYEVEE